jgi:ketosteroid isomerase-like protein
MGGELLVAQVGNCLPMSRANVEFAEGLYAAGAAGTDKQTLLASLPELVPQLCDPEIEWIEDPQRADRRIYRGHAGVRESWERWLEAFDEYSIELEQVIDCGDEDVLVVSLEQIQGAVSGAPMTSRHYAVLTIREGKLLRFREFYDEGAARQAARLQD